MIEDTRRAPRRAVPEHVAVTDRIREQVIGRLGNVSESGMLILSDAALVDDALYQLCFSVPDRHGQEVAIEVGVHLLWREPAHAPGQYWAGFRFLTLSASHRELLRQWISTGQTS